MSRIGKNPIAIPAGVDVTIDGQTVSVKGPKGALSHVVAEPITAKIETARLSSSVRTTSAPRVRSTDCPAR